MRTVLLKRIVLAGLVLAGQAGAAEAPIRVILVGDSTMASKSGYGDALCARFTPEVSCVNLARGGRSTGSFRAEGRWDEVQRMLKDGASFKATYVLVQFGHNDQPGKPGRSTDLVTQFPVNMARYAQETRDLGGVPVLVTPLTRRTFKGAYLGNDLAPWAEATRRAAAQEHAVLLDLNKDSVAAVQAMGQDEADTLAVVPRPPGYGLPVDPNKVEPAGAAKTAFDRTHLGAKGADFFARMVERELVAARPETAVYFKDGGKP
ncbi:rhamnogalacturonan acetylesterase [Telluria mixta]|uniref:Rhamnogalacturonan acetylesterase n=1 Tax=Telluria mixta TaxID=34071 RepID=A0ABT2BZC0_9BURK|nr:rhamnogalacturonan acetylesterase [Telluria mixta]MCS0630287.1 rhamnogalacturonan acetylesterase [Telluria mixta]WEM94403.1 rhamnogalacturonan acetylesterase [Telluria mixta]